MTYWALYHQHWVGDSALNYWTEKDAFAVCELDEKSEALTNAQTFETQSYMETFTFPILDKRSGHRIIIYHYKEINQEDFETFLAFGCGPEVKSRSRSRNHFDKKLYIPK